MPAWRRGKHRKVFAEVDDIATQQCGTVQNEGDFARLDDLLSKLADAAGVKVLRLQSLEAEARTDRRSKRFLEEA